MLRPSVWRLGDDSVWVGRTFRVCDADSYPPESVRPTVRMHEEKDALHVRSNVPVTSFLSAMLRMIVTPETARPRGGNVPPR